MNIIYTFHFLNGISEINTLFDDILIIWPAPVYATQQKGLLNSLATSPTWQPCSSRAEESGEWILPYSLSGTN